MTNSIALQVIAVGDVVPLGTVALDFYAEGIEDGIQMIEEGAVTERLAVAVIQGARLPQVADLLEGDVPVPADGTDEPDITVKVVLSNSVRWLSTTNIVIINAKNRQPLKKLPVID